jgi:hypothetical protein
VCRYASNEEFIDRYFGHPVYYYSIYRLCYSTISHVKMATVRKKPGNEGEAHGSAKLTTWQVKDIFERADYEPHKKLAREYNIHPHTVSNIRGGRRWKHLNLKNMSKGGTTPSM